jgi:hypothetical protein
MYRSCADVWAVKYTRQFQKHDKNFAATRVNIDVANFKDQAVCVLFA